MDPKTERLWGIRAFSSMKDIFGDVDLAVIVVPTGSVPGTLQECGEKMVKGVALITAGYKEIEDSQGEALEREIKEIAKRYVTCFSCI